MTVIPGHAAVLGGGWSGMLNAWVLAEAGWQVTVLERDRSDNRSGTPAGIPQGHHLHLLMPGGMTALEQLLPGIAGQLGGLGAQAVLLPRDVRWLTAAGWMPDLGSAHTLLVCSRPLMDYAVRERVLQHPRITLREGATAIGLLVTRGRTVGAQWRDRDSDVSDLAADLVLDATGRRSASPQWLADLGIAPPQEQTVDAGVAYASGIFRQNCPQPSTARQAYFIQPHPADNPRGGAAFPIEDGRWLVTLSGVRGHEPPTERTAFETFTRQLRSPELHKFLQTLEPAGPIRGFRLTPSRRRHYHRVHGFPTGLIVTGDAACTYNPQYGHGMSAAANAALALRRVLARNDPAPRTISSRAQRAVHSASRAPWQIATSEDLRYTTTVTDTPVPFLRGQHAALDRIVAAARRDRHVQRAFTDVMTLSSSPAAFLRPAALLATLSGYGR